MAKPLKFILLFTLMTCFNAWVRAQSDTTYRPEHLYQPQQLHADLAFLKSVLEEAHPSLYRYTSKDGLDAYFAVADQQLNQPLTDIEFWKIVEPVVAAIRSGHTVVYPSANYVEWWNKHGLSRIPLSVYALNGHLYAAWFPEDCGKLFRGARITAIDDNPGTVVFASLKPFVSSEGYSDQFVNYNIETTFPDLYGRVFGFKREYDVAFIDSSGKIQHATVRSYKTNYHAPTNQSKLIHEQKKSEVAKAVDINYFKDVPGTIELRIKTFSYLKDYKIFDVAFFKRLQDEKIKNLIIDLRGDGGGYLGIGIDMMRYMVRNAVVPANMITAVTNEYSFEKYIVYPGSDTLRKSVLIKTGKREYAAVNDYQVNYISSGYLFAKNVYLLVDKGTFSAAAIFAANLRAQRNVTILGDETGGGEGGTDGSGFSMVKFPNTELLLRLPQFWMQTTTRNKNTGHGVIPDIAVIPSIEDRVADRDVVLDKTLHLIVDKK